LYTLSFDAGYMANMGAGRLGRATNSPPQFGHNPFNALSAQLAQKVHSNEQMRASLESGASGLSQHSQVGRSCSMLSPQDGENLARHCKFNGFPSNTAALNPQFAD
jgi:hypothetical protein